MSNNGIAKPGPDQPQHGAFRRSWPRLVAWNTFRMMQAAAGALLARGCESLFVWVLRDNPSRWFYRHLGGQPAAEGQTRVAGVVLPQVAYRWERIEQLIGAKAG